MPTQPFTGSNVHLRFCEPEDAPALHTLLNHPDLYGRRYIGDKYPPYAPMTPQQVELLMQDWQGKEKAYPFVVIHSASEQLIGYAEISWGWDPHCPDVEVVISPEHWRKGYGSEVLKLLLAYLFDFTVAHNVSSYFMDWNDEARAFAQKHGFTDVGVFRRVGVRNGAYFDAVSVDLLRPEWQAKRGG